MALGAFVWFGKRGSPTRRPLLPLNAGTAEPLRVSPPEAVAYPLELPVCGHRHLCLYRPAILALFSSSCQAPFPRVSNTCRGSGGGERPRGLRGPCPVTLGLLSR